MNEIHQEENEEDFSVSTEKESIATSENHNIQTAQCINIQNISFKYNLYQPQNTLDDISISILQGKVTVIVGESGSGKTTLLKLLLAYYPHFREAFSLATKTYSNFHIHNGAVNVVW